MVVFSLFRWKWKTEKVTIFKQTAFHGKDFSTAVEIVFFTSKLVFNNTLQLRNSESPAKYFSSYRLIGKETKNED